MMSLLACFIFFFFSGRSWSQSRVYIPCVLNYKLSERPLHTCTSTVVLDLSKTRKTRMQKSSPLCTTHACPRARAAQSREPGSKLRSCTRAHSASAHRMGCGCMHTPSDSPSAVRAAAFCSTSESRLCRLRIAMRLRSNCLLCPRLSASSSQITSRRRCSTE